MLFRRMHDTDEHDYVNPAVQLNVGIWTLFASASFFLALRLWLKISRRHSLWYDDYILLVCWVILAANNCIISVQYATGYVTDVWDDRMHILINITSCGTLINQALTKTAFAVLLLKLTMTQRWLKWVLWFCIISMNVYMFIKVLFQWARICDKTSYDVWYRFNFCLGWKFRDDFKEGGNIYNIIMDFVLASVPWIITWGLEMRRAERVGLCMTMSLGMVVAIVSAVRTGWKDQGNVKDEWYFWRNAHSNIWYSSEIVGTIIVQCIPNLRPLIRDFHTSLTSKRMTPVPGTLGYVHDGQPSSRNRLSKSRRRSDQANIDPEEKEGLREARLESQPELLELHLDPSWKDDIELGMVEGRPRTAHSLV